MSDIALVIKISEDVYTRLFDNDIQDNEIAVDDVCEMARAIRKGIPLDDVLDKIGDEVLEYVDDLDIANEICKIFDKYESESETHCDYTDEEITKSFVEDVEVVKDLLSRAESEE